MEEPIVSPVVLDCGSKFTRVGFGGGDEPRTFPTMSGRIRGQGVVVGFGVRTWYAGDDAEQRCGNLWLDYPVKNGTVVNHDVMEQIYHHSFYYALRVAPEEQPVLLSAFPLGDKTVREKTTQVMFETFDVPALHIANRGTLSLYGKGMLTGLSVKIGHGLSQVTPVYEGHALSYAVETSEIGGLGMIEYLRKKLQEERKYDVSTRGQIELVRDVLQKHGCVPSEAERQNMNQGGQEQMVSYELPDGTDWKIGNERYWCTEGLFKPTFWDPSPAVPKVSVQDLVYNSLSKITTEAPQFRENFLGGPGLSGGIVLSGGCVQLPGFYDKFYKETWSTIHHWLACGGSWGLKISIPQSPQNNIWFGGSVFSQMSDFNRKAISKDEYNEVGPRLVDRKCF